MHFNFTLKIPYNPITDMKKSFNLLFQIKMEILSMKKYIFLFILFFVSHFLHGQFAESVRSIRPGNTMGVWTVGKGVLQVQQFLRFSSVESTSSRITDSNLGNLVRLGITERFEVQAIGNFVGSRLKSLDGTFEPSTESGISGLLLGARYHLGNPLGEEFFKSAIQVRVNLPHESDISKIDYLRTTVTLALGQKLTDRFRLNTAFGYQINSDDLVDNVFNLGIRANFTINEKSSLILEHFGTFINNNYVDGFDAGVDYIISDNVKVDLSAGWRNFPTVRSNFGVLGITYRFHKRDKIVSGKHI